MDTAPNMKIDFLSETGKGDLKDEMVEFENEMSER